ncbi:MAG: 2-oxoacid:ferredoxin oxidoreductase subunit gamma [Tissierellia bacterium]|nr:2-oxoacid:ferredoxin oxidoreductase subunit gamma [Tissierellia bacterium]
MMAERTIFAGFGGQGVMLMGQLLTTAGMTEGKHVSWLPSYGPEMRGGTANCSVMVDDKPIGSPIVAHNATSIVVMNQPSLYKFEEDLIEGGICLINSSLISAKPDREDVKAYYVPSNELAAELGNPRVANIVMLGALVELTGCVSKESILGALAKLLGPTKAHLMEINEKAFEKGAEAVRN